MRKTNIDSMDMSLSKLQEIVKTEESGRLQSWGPKRAGHNLVTKQQSLITMLY